MTETHLSRGAFERLQAELEELKTVGRVEIARAIQAARELGDLSENAEYHSTKDAQGKMEDRIRQLEHLIRTAVIVDEPAVGGEVSPGAVVSIRYEDDDDVERYLVGSIEEKPEGIELVSVASPLGQALLGRREGDVVEYATPTGATLKVEIVEVGA